MDAQNRMRLEGKVSGSDTRFSASCACSAIRPFFVDHPLVEKAFKLCLQGALKAFLDALL